MNPGDTFPITHSGIHRLSQVSLGENPKEGKTVLKVKAKGHTFVLCTLIKDEVEHQMLSQCFITEDEATLIVTGANSVNLIGTIEKYEMEDSSEGDEENELETLTGAPRYANYLSDLLGPDLPDEDEDEYEDEMEEMDEFGTLAFRDPTDNSFLGGFELRHFNLAPQVPGFERVNLREQEESVEDTLLHDNIAKGLVNALINSGDEFQIKKGKEFLRKLKRQSKQRKSLYQKKKGGK
ncbi:uncharacterized protein BX663DRAFT_525718 [Cokeromyces recurvatus]|uniref:uncharacterized protein n=1 Tax=Cokeromyces recurvatus TaxID=90255 RepID=UPI00221EA390|nr:uncharacterized protein BX663DRAFT_525718 [Cokeromyces recurvatus]KAI7898258.1 hypothetical protein BX663DRAFT_525718 [Cokeromyces recurvatus]